MRAQAQHIFIFIIGLVVISLIFLFGASTLENLAEDQCKIQRVQFGTNLQQAIERNKAFGANNIVQLRAPCETQQVCFVSRSIIDEANQGTQYTDANPIPGMNELSSEQIDRVVTLSVNNRNQPNVFIVDQEGIPTPLERYNGAAAAIQARHSTDQGILCIETDQGEIEMRMTGVDNTARIERVE